MKRFPITDSENTYNRESVVRIGQILYFKDIVRIDRNTEASENSC